MRADLPLLSGEMFLTDSGLETDLIFNRGFELPEFAAFVLLDSTAGRRALEEYYRDHLAVAAAHGCGITLETPTWRASRGWGSRIGYTPARLREVNHQAVSLVRAVAERHPAAPAAGVLVSGCIGPADDAYRPAAMTIPDEAEDYHDEQVAALAEAGADLVHGMTFTSVAEAVGLVRAAIRAEIPVAVSFTTETDGRLPDGSTLGEAVRGVDEATGAAAAYFGVNCAHPEHFAVALDAAATDRIRSVRPNASRLSHTELDESATLDRGDTAELARLMRRLRDAHPALTILGGCCGTDARDVAAVAVACLPAAG